MNQIRMYLIELLIGLQIKLAPKNNEGRLFLKHISNYLKDIEKND